MHNLPLLAYNLEYIKEMFLLFLLALVAFRSDFDSTLGESERGI
jgi:hypothetical protein